MLGLLTVIFLVSCVIHPFIAYFVFRKMGGGDQFKWYRENEVRDDLVGYVRLYRALSLVALASLFSLLILKWI